MSPRRGPVVGGRSRGDSLGGALRLQVDGPVPACPGRAHPGHLVLDLADLGRGRRARRLGRIAKGADPGALRERRRRPRIRSRRTHGRRRDAGRMVPAERLVGRRGLGLGAGRGVGLGPRDLGPPADDCPPADACPPADVAAHRCAGPGAHAATTVRIPAAVQVLHGPHACQPAAGSQGCDRAGPGPSHSSDQCPGPAAPWARRYPCTTGPDSGATHPDASPAHLPAEHRNRRECPGGRQQRDLSRVAGASPPGPVRRQRPLSRMTAAAFQARGPARCTTRPGAWTRGGTPRRFGLECGTLH